MKLLIMLVIALLASGQCEPSEKGVLASVREYPLFLHKCTATFLSQSTLLATGTCLLCPGTCNLFVRVFLDHLLDPKAAVYGVKKVLIHPDFEKNPSTNNIGLIYLNGALNNAPVRSLPPHGMDISGLPGLIYSWHFTSDKRDYHLVTTRVKTISSELCSAYLHEFVSNRYICLLGKRPLVLGPFDRGSPIVAQNTVLGIFIKPGVANTEIVQFQSIFPFIDWISQNIKPDDNNTTTTTTTTTTPTTTTTTTTTPTTTTPTTTTPTTTTPTTTTTTTTTPTTTTPTTTTTTTTTPTTTTPTTTTPTTTTPTTTTTTTTTPATTTPTTTTTTTTTPTTTTPTTTTTTTPGGGIFIYAGTPEDYITEPAFEVRTEYEMMY